MRAAIYSALVLATFIVFPANGQAQDCNVSMPTGCAGGEASSESHKANENSNGQYGGNIHGECWVCWKGGQGGVVDPEDCHACGGFITYDEGLAMTEAMNQGDLKALLDLAHRAPHMLSVNHIRTALQLTGCDGVSIVGSIPLTRAAAETFSQVLSSGVATTPRGNALIAVASDIGRR